MGASVVDGVVHFVDIVVERISVGKITVENKDNPEQTGLVIYDRKTGKPMCVYFVDGVMKSEEGDCEDVPADEPVEPDPIVDATRTPVEDGGGDTGTPPPEDTTTPDPVVDDTTPPPADEITDPAPVVEPAPAPEPEPAPSEPASEPAPANRHPQQNN